MKTHQRTIPSPTAVNREFVFWSMGRTCRQSGSFIRAALIQFTKANLSSSEACTHTHTRQSSLNAVTQHGPKLDLWVDSDGLAVAEAQTEPNVLSHMFPDFLVWDYYYLQGRVICFFYSVNLFIVPEKECCVPSLDCCDVPPMAKMPSFLLRTVRNVLAISLHFSSWTI